MVFRTDAYQQRILIHPGASDDVKYVGWEVADADALRGLVDHLEGAGVPVATCSGDEARDRAVLELARFADAEGLTQEVFFGATMRTDSPFCSPVGRRPFITGKSGLGHIVLSSRNYAGQTDFYAKTLGFKISDYITQKLPFPPFEANMTFMRCNPRHHSFALGDFPTGRQLNHLMLEVGSLDDVGFAYDRAKKAGAHILMDLGRHSNDKMFSFYVLTPSGWSIEIGWDGISIDEETWHVARHDNMSSWGHALTPPGRPAAAKDQAAE
jgi:2,3-dihydroxybiphenyl 1,2-dioxygenase